MIIYGAGGHARVVIDILEAIGKTIDFIVDDNPEIQEELGYKVLRPQVCYDEAVIAIGNCIHVCYPRGRKRGSAGSHCTELCQSRTALHCEYR